MKHRNVLGRKIIAAGLVAAMLTTGSVSAFAQDYAAPSVVSSTARHSARIEWSAIEGALSYEIFDESGTVIDTLKSGEAVYSHDFDEVKCSDKPYVYTVKAYFEDGQSTSSNVSFSVNSQLGIPAFKSLTASSVTSAILTWNAAANADGYYVYRHDYSDGGSKYTRISGLVTTLSYKDTTVKAGHKYAYCVKSVDKLCSKVSTKSTVKTIALPGTTKASASIISDRSIKIKWTKAAQATGYIVRVKVGSTGSYKTIAKTKGTSYTYNMKAKVAKKNWGKTLYVRVRPYNSSIKGSVSDTSVSFKPAKVKLKKATSISTSANRITWKPNLLADGYYIYRRAAGGKFVKLVTITDESKKKYVDKTAKTGTLYYYTVKSYWQIGGSAIIGDYDKTGLSVITQVEI